MSRIAAFVWSAVVACAASPDPHLADAVEKMDRAAVRALVARHANVDEPQIDGTTALHWAARQDDLEIARLLLAYGKTETARRRLKRVVDDFGNTSAGVESRNLLISIEVTSLDDQPPQANCPVETGRSK